MIDPAPLEPGDLRLTGRPTPAWTAGHVRRIAQGPYVQAPVIAAADVRPVLPGRDVWDMWPLATADGATARVAGGRLWFALAAPVRPHPDERHDLARIRILHEVGDRWRDCGDAFPDGFTPGSREWSGSALLRPGGEVLLFFTASGRRSERQRTFEQRLFQAAGRLDVGGPAPRIVDWRSLRESVAADDDVYLRVDATVGEPGMIKALRDPAYFRDPADGASYLLFAASLKRSASAFNSAIGIARAEDERLERWTPLSPLLHADEVSNELERPHAVFRHGLYYVFWCAQDRVFAPGACGPTGLYGVVGKSLFGPYQPLNGTGLALANPAAEPAQAYAWWVTSEDEVWSFIDQWGVQGRSTAADPHLARRQFGGTFAPVLRLRLSGARAWVE